MNEQEKALLDSLPEDVRELIESRATEMIIESLKRTGILTDREIGIATGERLEAMALEPEAGQ